MGWRRQVGSLSIPGENMPAAAVQPPGVVNKILWAAVVVLGAVSFAVVALKRGEPVNAAWLVIAAVCIYLIAYRFYALWVARRVLGVDPTRETPAFRHNDGLDYVPTHHYVHYGHHFVNSNGMPRTSRRHFAFDSRASSRSWASALSGNAMTSRLPGYRRTC